MTMGGWGGGSWSGDTMSVGDLEVDRAISLGDWGERDEVVLYGEWGEWGEGRARGEGTPVGVCGGRGDWGEGLPGAAACVFSSMMALSL